MPTHSTPSQPTAPTASQNANGALKEELWKGHEQDMRQVERILAQSGLSDPKSKSLQHFIKIHPVSYRKCFLSCLLRSCSLYVTAWKSKER